MPAISEDDNKVFGVVMREDPDTHNYTKCWLVIDFTSRVLRYYPLEETGIGDFATSTVIEEIRCSYITKVNPAVSRPRVLNCIVLALTGTSRFFCVDDASEKDEWIAAIKHSTTSQASAKTLKTANPRGSIYEHQAYMNHVVGGVIQRKPIKEVESNTSESNQLTSSGPAAVGATPSDAIVAKQLPRVIKAGQATKCGAVMKNWKRRFFVLNEECLGYYKLVDEVEPIKTVAVKDMMSVGKSKIHASKENLLELVTPSRTFYIQADNGSDMREWMKAFQVVIDYTRSSNSLSLPVSTSNRITITTDRGPIIQPYEHSPKYIGNKDNNKNGSKKDPFIGTEV